MTEIRKKVNTFDTFLHNVYFNTKSLASSGLCAVSKHAEEQRGNKEKRTGEEAVKTVEKRSVLAHEARTKREEIERKSRGSLEYSDFVVPKRNLRKKQVGATLSKNGENIKRR